jgi:uncharacterized RDD family membrane protein YckC
MDNLLNNFTTYETSKFPKIKSHATLATPQSRLIAYVLDGFIFGCTLGIGWFLWFCITATRGTTPGHDLMGHEVRDTRTGLPASVFKMFLRECFVKGIVSWTLASITFLLNYLIDGAMIFREDRRTAHDHLLRTEVIQVRDITIFDKLQR